MRAELDELRSLVNQFKELYEAAKKIDVITKQPDCEDPEKARLVDRVRHLEGRLNLIEAELKAEQFARADREKKEAAKKARARKRVASKRAGL